MAPKTSKLARLHELAAYVRQPDKLAELQARSGNHLKEKLRQLVPGEKVWYKFLNRSKGFDAEGQALLAELDAEVTRQPARQVASHGGSSSSCLATDRTTTARVQPRQRRPAESVPETTDKRLRTQTAPPTTRTEASFMHGLKRTAESVPDTADKSIRTRTLPLTASADTLCMRGLNIQWPFSQLILMGAKSEEVRAYDLGHRNICNASEETWIVETRGKSACSTTNAICDDLAIAPRPDAAQIVGTVTFDSSHQYDSSSADAEHCATAQEHVFLLGVPFCV